MMKRRTLLSALAAASATAVLPARAQQSPPKIVFGYTAVTDFASVFVAAEEGYFKKRSLDVELKFIPLNSTIPAALQSDSLQIGGPTPSVFLQAVDGGLDLVLVAGGGLTSKTMTGFGLVARAGSGIKSPQDCVGKKIGVPGLGAFLHVTFRAWLKDSGAGYVASYYSTFLPEHNQTIVHAAKREWVEKNPATARAFREALVESAGFMQQPKNDAKVRAAIGKYIKLPPEVLAKVQVSPPGPVVTDKQLGYWTGLMKEQDMLKTNIDVAKLIAR